MGPHLEGDDAEGVEHHHPVHLQGTASDKLVAALVDEGLEVAGEGGAGPVGDDHDVEILRGSKVPTAWSKRIL